MKILISNHHLLDYAGSEIFTLNLAKGLKRFGHEVVVYSKFIDKIRNDFEKRRIRYVANLTQITKERFDIAHVHHNISAYEVRYYFPKLPMLFLSHGSTPFLEQPPIVDLNIQLFGAVAEIVRQMLIRKKVPKNMVEFVNNIIDEDLFYPTSSISSKPKTALLLSSRIDTKREQVIRKACAKMRIQLFLAGQRFDWVPNRNLPPIINKSDIVFTIGRGVMETMMCGRIPFIFDISGGDGILTPEMFDFSFKYNFSGKHLKKNFTSQEIVKEINQKYNKNLGDQLKKLALDDFSISNNIPKIIEIYKKTIQSFRAKPIDTELLEYIINIINHSVFYQQDYTKRNIEQKLIDENKNFKKRIDDLEIILANITSAKTFRIWQSFCHIRKLIIDK